VLIGASPQLTIHSFIARMSLKNTQNNELLIGRAGCRRCCFVIKSSFRLFLTCSLAILLLISAAPCSDASDTNTNSVQQRLRQALAQYAPKSGAYVLEKGEESLLARAALVNHAQNTINVQYFIWSNDNIGILASEALLRAAERGVTVRVIVDDLLIKARRRNLLALAAHPNVNIRIYNPKHSVGTNRLKRLWNTASDFRGVNQRMHDKIVTVDGIAAITGGRNMADEYYDYDHRYNFRDRDILLLGPVVTQMEKSFDSFWDSELSVPVEQLLTSGAKPMSPEEIRKIYDELHDYAQEPDNFAPVVRQALLNVPREFTTILDAVTWDDIDFISDIPGKNSARRGLAGGGVTTRALIDVLQQAQKSITIQSPYLVLPDGGLEFFAKLIQRGVRVRISTNSLGSTDNLLAFSGYHKQRKKLLKTGIEIYEYRPAPEIQNTLMQPTAGTREQQPIFAIHAKTFIVDSRHLYIGTFNLDPRSANLNTEVGVLIDNAGLAQQVEQGILIDMAPSNSWRAGQDKADGEAPLRKRIKMRFFKLLPLTPVL